VSILYPLLGGALIGLSASAFLLLYGRPSGISGMVAAVLPVAARRGEPPSNITDDKGLGSLAFLLGLVATGAVARLVWPQAFGVAVAPLGLVLLAGVLVGFGTRLGGGCTSGHGVCGISRFSKRSILATMTFMAVAMLAVFVVRLLGVA
jgi:uncharacterized protein